MRTADEAKLGSGILILPHNGIVLVNSFKLCVVDNVCLCAVGDEAFAKLNCFGSEVVNVIKSDCTVGSGSRTEILEISLSVVGKLCADPLVKSLDVGNVLHNLHTYCRAENLSFGDLGSLYLDNPLCLSALVRKEIKFGNLAEN